MTEELPAPLTPADADLRHFGFMPLDVQRLLTSEWWINALEEQPEACGPAVNLWGTAWHQVPAGSLPGSDAVLRRIAGVDRKTWETVRERVMQPWVKCSDGRLYHTVVAEKVNEALALKTRKSEGGREGNRRRWGSHTDRSPIAKGSDTDRQPIGSDAESIGPDRKDKTDKTDKTDSSSAREAALTIIEAFDAALVDAYGQERKRPFPVGTDIVHARRWHALGFQAPDLYEFFVVRQRARKDKGREPIGSLAFLEQAVAELAGVSSPSSTQAAPGAAQVRFMSPEAEIRARRDWMAREREARVAAGTLTGPMDCELFGLRYDMNAQDFRLKPGDRPPIPPPPQAKAG